MGEYGGAQICLNGHTITYDYETESPLQAKFCKKCGDETITQCLNCNSAIRGEYRVPDIVIVGSTYEVPSFCHDCGQPYPWTQTLLDNAVEIVGLDEDLKKDDKEVIKSTFPDLITETPTTPVAVAKYKKYVNKTQDYVKEGLRNLLIKVVSEAVRRSIWN